MSGTRSILFFLLIFSGKMLFSQTPGLPPKPIPPTLPKPQVKNEPHTKPTEPESGNTPVVPVAVKAKAGVISWTKPAELGLPHGESHKVLSFAGAQYTKDFLPLYLERIKLPSQDNEASVTLVNPVYEALDAVSEALVNKKKISPLVSPKVVITYERKMPTAEVTFVPLRLNPVNGRAERLKSFSLKLVSGENQALKALVSKKHIPAASSVLASGTWYRLGVSASGVYKISYGYLKSLGIDLSKVNLQQIQIYGNGGAMLPFQNSAFRPDDLLQDAIFVTGGSAKTRVDSSDYILFYGQSPNIWTYTPGAPAGTDKFVHTVNQYSDTTFYFLTTDATVPSKRIAAQASVSQTASAVVSSFDDYAYIEHDSQNLIQSGRQWYGEQFEYNTSYSYPFFFPNLDTSVVTVNADLVARADGDSTYYQLKCQNTSSVFYTMPVSFATYWADYAEPGIGSILVHPGSPSFSVSVTQQSQNPNLGWMNFVEVNVRRKLQMTASQMSFRDGNTAIAGAISQFVIGSATKYLAVWDVTNGAQPAAQVASFDTLANNLVFTQHTDSLREFMVFDSTASGLFSAPVSFGPVQNQDLHATPQVDYVIVSNPLFLDQAQRLAGIHATHDHLSSVVVTPQQIYNEFSSGRQDVTAIRDFVRMLYNRATGPATMPKYLLLFGDGSYDPKHRLPANTNFIVAFENSDALNYSDSYVSDEFFCLLDDTEGGWDSGSDIGSPDIGVGRFPVRNEESAKTVVDKIEKYISLGSPPPISNCNNQTCSVMRDWRNVVCFVADDGDGDTHLYQAEQLAAMVDTAYHSYNIDKIYLDAYQEDVSQYGSTYPGVVDAINQRIADGALIFNYTGHGSTSTLSHETVVQDAQISAWTNLCNLPFFVTATCEFAQYDNPGFVSAGELILLNPNGAGIGLLTTVRLVFSTPNFVLNQNFYRCAFQPVDGQMPRLGDLFRITQTLSGSLVNNRNFSLLGDPALRLAYPDQKTVTSVVNNKPVTTLTTDTVLGLSHVSVSGFVTDTSGNLLTNFNGTVYPTVYDKASMLTTLSNAGTTASPPATFSLRKNIIYRGKASIINGKFQFSFVVPKDIGSQFGTGKISYYFENGLDDGAGFFSQFQVGGMVANPAVDKTGPRIKLFLNDSTFLPDGITNSAPRIYASVFDSSGINTVGNGVGHNLAAVLDNNVPGTIVLNDYYTADLNTYRSGKVVYPLSGLAEGQHTLSLKAWDVYDNPSQAYTDFLVSSSAQLALQHVLNWPNPFTTHTQFFFEDNECCQTLVVEIEIYTITGKLVKTIQTTLFVDGHRSPPIDWNGRDDFGDKIGRGVYVYRLSVRSPSGGTSEKVEKLVILN